MKNKTNLQQKYNKLLRENANLKTQNNLLQTFYKPTAKDKLQSIEDYFKWCTKNDYDCRLLETYLEYKDEIEKRSKYEQYSWKETWNA